MPVMRQFDYTNHLTELVTFFSQLEQLSDAGELNSRAVARARKSFARPDGGMWAKDELVAAYMRLAGSSGLKPVQESILKYLRMKPVRTQSGVAPITVLTKPFPCPGKCIFCPNDIRMPKSYLSDEPGAQRAERNWFDPYLQTYNRLQALKNIGHTVSKAEIIILGGTWSYYPEQYQIWFVAECFRALNDFGSETGRDDRATIQERYQQMQRSLAHSQYYAASDDPAENKTQSNSAVISGENIVKTYNQTVSELYVAPEKLGGFDAYQTADWTTLERAQVANESTACRCVGLVVETRPDNISVAEVSRMRRLGCTKAQIGFQSLNDEVLLLNHRGHDVAATRRAVKLLRLAGFKIHAHWMANLYGSDVEKDMQDFDLMFSDPDFRPDELKIYPCSLIQSAELMQYYRDGLWQPYTHAELLKVVSHCMQNTPEYCRLTRVIRDIPSPDIVVGNKHTNFRQMAEKELQDTGSQMHDIRSREIKNMSVTEAELELDEVIYQTSCSTEYFLQYITAGRKIAGFLRLSLPKEPSFMSELADCAVVREVHVYGRVAGLSERTASKAQHLGLGSALLKHAAKIDRENQYEKMAVISAIGTKSYYRKQGFTDGVLYQTRSCQSDL